MREKKEKLASDVGVLASLLARNLRQAASPSQAFTASPAAINRLASVLASRLASPASRAASPAAINRLASVLASRLASPVFQTASPKSINRLASNLASSLISKVPQIAASKVQINFSDMNTDTAAKKIAGNVASVRTKLTASPLYTVDALASRVARYLVSPGIVASPYAVQNLASKVASLLSQEFKTTEGELKIEDLNASEISEKKKTKKQK